MRKPVLLLASAILAISSTSIAAPKGAAKSPSKETIDAYLKIQESLATDSLQGANEGATELAKTTHDKRLAGPATAISRDTKIADARKHFKQLSGEMIKRTQKEKPAGVDEVNCPMAKASWLQKHGPVMNPYYGKKMQECGEIKK